MRAPTASWKALAALLLVTAALAAGQDGEEAPEAPDLDEGQTCDSAAGVRGICRSITVCASAIAELRRGAHPKLCRYAGKRPIVCCPPQPQPQRAPDSEAETPPPASASPADPADPSYMADLFSGGGGDAPAATEAASPGPAGPGPAADAWEVAAQKCEEYKRLAADAAPGLAAPARRSARSILPGPGGKGVKQCAKPGDLLAAADGGGFGAERRPSLALLQEFPHMVLVGYGEGRSIEYSCVGALIAPDRVLTAAHCLSNGSVPAGWVLPGVLSSSVADDAAGPQLTAVAERTAHPDADIAILRLEQAVVVNGYVRPACLETDPTRAGPAVGSGSGGGEHQDLLIAGWGTTLDDSGITGDFLQKAALRGAECAAGAAADGGVLCAGGPGRQACLDDTPRAVAEAVLQRPLDAGRGEAYCLYAVAGLSSVRGDAGCGDAPGVFTAVRHYVPWIVTTVWPSSS